MPLAVLIVNPISGSRSADRALAAFRRALDTGGVESTVRPTRGPRDAAAIAEEEARAGADFVVAVGGDGTVNEVAAGLVEASQSGAAQPTALALLPRGTSNLVARDLGIPFDPARAALVLVRGTTGAIDVATANGRVFVACLGVGWDAHVVRLLARARKGHIGFHTWAVPIARALASYTFSPLHVTAADGTTAEGVFALVFNTRPYAAFFTPAPAARCDDGLLDALVIRRGGALDVPRLTWKGLRGTLPGDASVTLLRSTGFRVEAPEPLPWQIDGDVGAETPVDILVRPGALRVMRPAQRRP